MHNRKIVTTWQAHVSSLEIVERDIVSIPLDEGGARYLIGIERIGDAHARETQSRAYYIAAILSSGVSLFLSLSRSLDPFIDLLSRSDRSRYSYPGVNCNPAPIQSLEMADYCGWSADLRSDLLRVGNSGSLVRDARLKNFGRCCIFHGERQREMILRPCPVRIMIIILFAGTKYRRDTFARRSLNPASDFSLARKKTRKDE